MYQYKAEEQQERGAGAAAREPAGAGRTWRANTAFDAPG